jgi:hypothetical protein
MVTGSRDWPSETLVQSAIRRAMGDLHSDLGTSEFVVVHGACPTGADAMADRYARSIGIIVDAYPADWKTFGKRAGHMRNRAMVDSRPDILLAFNYNSSRGTAHAYGCAIEAGLPWRLYTALDTLNGVYYANSNGIRRFLTSIQIREGHA